MKPRDLIVKAHFGSTVYGTITPKSDQDFKSVFVPTAKEILLQRVPATEREATKTDQHSKNQPGDVDHESFSLQKYLSLLCEGQTGALDLLFTPKRHVLSSSYEWDTIVANKDKFLTKSLNAFVGYTRTQASKYGVKGYRVAAVKAAIDFFSFISSISPDTRLSSLSHEIQSYVDALKNEHFSVVQIEGAKKGEYEPAICVCDRKIPFHSRVGYVVDTLTKIYENYGHRAKLAESNEGLDYKALSHAVRVASECIELLKYGTITFPRPDRELLLKIKTGQLAYAEIEEIIEKGLEDCEAAMKQSTLPDKPDCEWVDSFLEDVYRKKIASEPKDDTCLLL